MNAQHALLIVGSPKPGGSTSEKLGQYLLEQLQQAGMTTDLLHTYKALRTPKLLEAALAEIDRADLIIIAFPLYIDSLPAILTELLEKVAAHRHQTHHAREQRLMCIVNCGFPEAHHNALALEICQQFALETGMVWAGGIAIGEGGMVNANPLSDTGGPLKPLALGLQRAAAELADNGMISENTCGMISRPLAPTRIYLLIASLGWHWQAYQNRAHRFLWRRPFATNHISRR